MSNSNLPSSSGQNKPNPIQTASNLLNTRNTAYKPIQYSERITSINPCAFVLLLDQSGSMRDDLEDNNGVSKSKAEHLALIVNQFLDEIIITCQKTDIIKEYFEILIIGYGREDKVGNSIVQVAWEGPLEDKIWVGVNELRNGSKRKETISVPNKQKFGPRVKNEEVNIWIDCYAEGVTPMKGAFMVCKSYLDEWVFNHPNSFPPIVFNITDGAATDVDEYEEIADSANEIKNISTSDGNVLLFNFLLSDDYENLVEYPLLSDRYLFENEAYEAALFDASSPIPASLIKYIQKSGLEEGEIVKGLVFGNIQSIMRVLNIGTSTLRNNIN